jgi:hypothetical protein
MKIRLLLSTALICGFLMPAKADEGMWLPILLSKLNIADMKAKGFKLSAEDIYSINQASLKDAVVMFDGGCTGEIVSDQGLLLTNHHCGLDKIQSHSTLEHNYIENGFWAMSQSEELVNPGITATLLKRMEDVSAKALEGVTDGMPEADRQKQIKTNCERITREATAKTHYKAMVKSFFGGNQYFLFVNEVFEDVRLVGAPPAAIGKFGGDTDNWMWPRHTGDFSVFRIYADKNNQAAPYSADNVPYKPAKHFGISAKGIKEGDFTMVFGYPGTTEQYVPSFHINMLQNHLYPKLVDIRTQKLNIIKKWMASSEAISIQYTSKDARIANAWKKWKGEIAGLKRLNAIDNKKQFEEGFQQWANQQPDKGYNKLINDYSTIYPSYIPLKTTEQLIYELTYRNGIEIMEIAYQLRPLYAEWTSPAKTKEAMDDLKTSSKAEIELFFKDYCVDVDKEMAVALLNFYKTNVPDSFALDIYKTIDKKFKGNTQAYVNYLYKNSFLTNQQKVLQLIDADPAKATKILSADAGWKLYQSLMRMGATVSAQLAEKQAIIAQLNRNYIAAKMLYEPQKMFYPDANSTLRVAYGNVKGYTAADAIDYNYFTTLDGIMEKSMMDVPDYQVPARLKELYKAKDFGRYNVNGTVPVAFVANNHTTGGNSGSPVLNANGRLIGINFDRAWDGVTSDLVFNKQQSRNISVDIRYVLFIIDKYAGAGYLLDEMDVEW